MKKSEILESVEYVDTRLIDEARNFKPAIKKNGWIKFGATAACLCLIIGGALGLSRHFGNTDSIKSTKDIKSINAQTGLHISPVEFPETTDGIELDMMGLVVYKGGIYTQSENYYGSDAEKIDSLVGDYLGYATGSIDEWSEQEEYSKEFASSVAGEVYSVKGYDTDFRICIRQKFTGEEGKEGLFIEFLDRLNGITLNTGKDLFEDRLNIRKNTEKIMYQSHSDWNMAKENYKEADISAEVWEEFLNRIDKEKFINTWNDYINQSDTGSNNKSIYDTENQAHLFLTMNDGTVIRLRLIEGGYVGYDALGWYFVKIPGDTFDAVFNACK